MAEIQKIWNTVRFLLLLLCGCAASPLRIVTVQSCQYVTGKAMICHSGNCTNRIHYSSFTAPHGPSGRLGTETHYPLPNPY